MRSGRRLGVDVGTVRIGLAQCDPEALLATPLVTITAGKKPIEEICRIAEEISAIEIIVGLPTSLSGHEGDAASKAREFAHKLHEQTPIPVRLVDERLSTVVATHAMRASRVNSRKARSSIDQAAAVVILQSALDAERGSGKVPGELLR
ncbi:MAG TPA: Holliday junction resolvase RuvX [Candidatus Nanopelagicaceae bacterium]|nr:Holliday junction resolvase RuvX [Candidatus Nanopelagicaceae bacterium]